MAVRLAAFTAAYDPVARYGRGFVRHVLAASLRSFRHQIAPSRRRMEATRARWLAKALGEELPADVVAYFERLKARRVKRP